MTSLSFLFVNDMNSVPQHLRMTLFVTLYFKMPRYLFHQVNLHFSEQNTFFFLPGVNWVSLPCSLQKVTKSIFEQEFLIELIDTPILLAIFR